MSGVLIVGVTVVGAVAGGIAGFCIGVSEGGDFNLAPVLYTPVGALAGGLLGVITGACVFS